MLLTRTKAIQTLRSETGCSLKTAEQKVAAMTGIQDGCRSKVDRRSVRAAINDILTPRPVNVRPLSEKQLARLQG